MDLQIQVKQNKEYDNLVKSLQELQEIQDNLAELLIKQDENIDSVEEQISSTSIHLDSSLIEIQEAKRLRFRYYPMILGGILGGAIGGPLGFLVGVKYTGLTASAGTVLGGVGGYFVQ